MKRLLLCIAVCLVAAGLVGRIPAAAQSGINTSSPFLGLWCISDDPNRQALITRGDFGLTLRIEHGPTSTGVIEGVFSHQVVAPQWNQLRGVLSDDEESITWSDGTYWTRCRPRINISGVWYLNGNPSQPCRIDQNGGSLRVRNDAGQPGTGAFTSRTQISVVYYGVWFHGTISADGNRIDWDNGTYWLR